MKKDKKLTKKASVKVWNVASKFHPNLSKNTSYDEAWEIIAKEGDLEGEIETSRFNQTKFILYRGEEQISIYELGAIFKDGDYDWTAIYKTVCEDVVARRLYKKPKLSKKAQKAKDEEIAKQVQARKLKEAQEEAIMVKEQQTKPEPEQTKEELDRLKFNLKMKIRNWAKKGKDVAELEEKLTELETKIKAKKNVNKKSKEKPQNSAHIQEISEKMTKSISKEKSSVKSKISKSSNGGVKSKKIS